VRSKTFSSIRTVVLILFGVVMIVPLYLLITNAFKSQPDIFGAPFTFPHGITFKYLVRAIQSPTFNVVGSYAITAFFVIAVNVIGLAITGPAAYVIARGKAARHRLTLVVLISGLFIPSQALVIPVIYVLKTVGLMGTVPGYLLFEASLTIPVNLFLFVSYIQTIPGELDESARMDGATRWGTYWRIIFPLMRPVVATAVILNTIGVWGDFVTPQIILGPSSGIYTVTTGVYAAISKFSSDYTTVYPNLLLAVAPMLIFFVLMQRRIAGGLTAGAVKS
jgi:raffinose/stachyose/melibiose transport system permease protein